jgi:threonine aldolase
MTVAADFRSDTVTRPTEAMYQAMVTAPVGDDVFGDDPTVLLLEAEVASLLGKESAVFVTTGTLSNQLALRINVGPLQEVLCDHRSHIHVWEVGGIHALCGASVAAAVPEPSRRFLCEEAVRANTRSGHSLYHQPVTRLLSLEQTLNGEVMPLSQMAAACAQARALGLATHLDGARIWNACAATGTSPADYAAHFDTVSVCLSKGLGAPVGSVLVGSSTAIDRARHYRKLYGGGWRQAGLLAAAGLHALREHRARMVEDHENASYLAHELRRLGFDVQPPQTNMVWCDPPPGVDMDALIEGLRAEKLLIGGAYTGPRRRQPFGESAKSMRLVTHLQTPRSACHQLVASLSRLVRPALRSVTR